MPVAALDRLTIERGSSAATIDPFGAYVATLSLDGDEVIEPTADGFQTHGGIAVLMPYAGRVREGKYSFEGKDYQLPKGKDGHAIHGFAKDTLWKVARMTESSVSLKGTLKGTGYPGTLEAILTYSVGETFFSTSCQVKNAGTERVPLVIGFHPYLKARRWQIEVGVPVFRYQLREGYFPTGKRARFSFEGAGPGTVLDDCFVTAGTIKLLREGTELVLRRRKMPYFVVYDGRYARGTSVAIEPYTGLPDAFNSGLGLRVLAPGRRFRCGYDLVTP